MQDCKVCREARSPFILNNRTVCLRCDELLFDIEIECWEKKEEAPKRRLFQESISITKDE